MSIEHTPQTLAIAERRDHHAALACELLLAGDIRAAQRHARERRRAAQHLMQATTNPPPPTGGRT